MPVGSTKRGNFIPVKPAKQRCAPKVQRELGARPWGADSSSITVVWRDWAWPLKWPQPKPWCVSWCEEWPKCWTKTTSGSGRKNRYGKSLMCLSAAQPCGYGAAQPTQQQNSLHGNAWKISLSINRKEIFSPQDISLQVLQLLPKTDNLHFQPKLCNYSIYSSFPWTILEI